MSPAPGNLESPSGCRLCGSDRVAPLIPYRVGDRPGDEVFRDRTIVSCHECGLSQIDRAPSEAALARYYEADYRSSGAYSDVDIDEFPHDSPWYLSRGRAIAELVISRDRIAPDEPRVILDIGAGFGHVLWAFSERLVNASLHAVEPDPRCAPFLERVGAELHPTDSRGMPSESIERRFDIAVMAHVLEHLRRPVESIAALRRLLAREGRAIIEVPNSPPSNPEGWVTVPHLSFFTPESLQAAVVRAGARIHFLETCGPVVEAPIWKRVVPAGIKRAVRKLPGFAARSTSQPDGGESSRIDGIPIPYFGEYGGPRGWIRVIISFDDGPSVEGQATEDGMADDGVRRKRSEADGADT